MIQKKTDSLLNAFPNLPITMSGSAMSIWISNKQVKNYSAYLPKGLVINSNDEIRLRVWDLKMDFATELNHNKYSNYSNFKEGVLAIPSTNGKTEGEFPLHMFSDSFVYTSMAREIIGWNVRDGKIHNDKLMNLKAGQNLKSKLITNWNFAFDMEIRNITLSNEKIELPNATWFANKVVHSPFESSNYSDELIIGGSSKIYVNKIWKGEGGFTLNDKILDTEINSETSIIKKVEIWEGLSMSVGYAKI